MKIREDARRAKARSRLTRLDTVDILDWSDTTLRDISDLFAEYRRHRDPAIVKEALVGVSTLAGALDVLGVRS